MFKKVHIQERFSKDNMMKISPILEDYPNLDFPKDHAPNHRFAHPMLKRTHYQRIKSETKFILSKNQLHNFKTKRFNLIK